MLVKLKELRKYFLQRGLHVEAGKLSLLVKHAESEEDLSEDAAFSVLDLMGSNESVAGQHYKKPQHIINYSEDQELGNGFTGDSDDLGKKAHGLFDVPYGSPDGNISHRRRDKYEQQDKEVAESFFGAESNIDSEESYPPINIERCNNKPINILDQTKYEDFFSFLHSNDGKLKRKIRG